MADSSSTDDEDAAAQTLQRHCIALGRRLRSVRRYRDITQVDLAKRTGISRPRLSDMERGKANLTFETLLRLAIALNVYPPDLLDDRADLGQTRPYRPPDHVL